MGEDWRAHVSNVRLGNIMPGAERKDFQLVYSFTSPHTTNGPGEMAVKYVADEKDFIGPWITQAASPT
ncbi:uncharacterized protein PHALS_03857 [Plasmopara halstedii]|uniref:Uncharacterized protein n=1 Tax=Plasmopara halstedii TaxID=4781 RepID=A0A0P1AZD6_PLAHL|nr:uncharacterized protein PHALS_03857 [Plasmopara halstedii]CEG47209.1 hypothetical protein PHALS_03857 [Plasmopara halstedii]|eukprot:XP_024583578.1 hypothetical protein PHALS_03857 [Plasmopara halstedii]